MPKKTAAGTKKKTNPKTAATPRKPRVLTLPQRIWYKPLTWRFSPPVPQYKPLPKARHLFAASIRQMWQYKPLFGGLVLVYGVAQILLIRGLSGASTLPEVTSAIQSVIHGFGGKVAASLGGLTYLFATSGSGNFQSTGPFQYLLLIVCSLAVIYALRQVSAKYRLRTRDTFYRGMYPIIPFVLVLLICAVQLVPLAAGGTLLSFVLGNHIANTALERLPFILILIGLAFWTLRMLTSSVFALYVVTLPDMTPVRAVRSASQLVYGRRLLVWRKVVFLPTVLLLCVAAIEIPLILLMPSVAPWVFFALSMIMLPATHAYLYNLYREML